MKIKILPLGHIKSNCYLISTDKAAVAVDVGFESDEVTEFFENSAEKQKLILLTHSHFDHIGGALELRDKFGVKIAIGEHDAPALSDTALNLSNKFHARLKPFSADIILKDDQTIGCGDIEFKVIETAGHTRGGVCYLLGDNLFSGDTLFCESVGRTDFLDGDFDKLCESVKKLYELSDNVTVYPGHGGTTTIGHEKRFNPYIRG